MRQVEFISRPGDHVPEAPEIEAADSAPGAHEVGVIVHRTRFVFEGLDEALVEAAGPLFGNFRDETTGAVDRELRIRIGLAPRETFLAFRTTTEPERYRILVARSGEAYRFVSYHFAALYHPGRREARVALARGPGRREQRLLENLFRVLSGYALIEEGEVLIHAVALERRGRGFVFFGPSGAGKTTVARLSRDRTRLLSDDQALLSVEGDRVLLSGTPFRGGERVHPERHPDALPGPNENRTVPLAGLFRLVQAPRMELRDRPSALQVAGLLSAVPAFPGEPYNNDRLLGTLTSIVERVPPRDLHFLPDPSFWDLVDP